MRKSEKQKKIDALFSLHSHKPNSDIIKCTLLREENGTNMRLHVDPESFYVVKSIAENYGNFNSKGREAFLKAYYLYELLVQDFILGDWIIDNEIKKTLNIDSKTLEKIRQTLEELGIMYVDTTEYKKSLKKHIKAKFKKKCPPAIKRYRYVPGVFINNNCISVTKDAIIPKNIPIYITYNLSSYLYELVKFYKDLEGLASRREEDQSESVLNILLRFLRRNKLIFSNKNEELSHNTQNNYPEWIYISPYEKLDLNYGLSNIVMTVRKWETLLIWIVYHHNQARVTNNSRLWHPFHNLAKEYRKHITYNGSYLVEAMDVHNCFYVLMLKAFEQDSSIDRNELQNYSEIVRAGKLYELFVNEKFKELPPNCYDYKNVRTEIKKQLQSYRNISSEGQLRHEHLDIDNIFKRIFPNIRNALLNYPTYIKDGKKVKRLQNDMCHIETYIISKVCNRLTENGVTPFSLHDGIYLSEDEIEKLRIQLGLDSIQSVQKWIEGLFWNFFDDLTPQMVKHLLNNSTPSNRHIEDSTINFDIINTLSDPGEAEERDLTLIELNWMTN